MKLPTAMPAQNMTAMDVRRFRVRAERFVKTAPDLISYKLPPTTSDGKKFTRPPSLYVTRVS